MVFWGMQRRFGQDIFLVMSSLGEGLPSPSPSLFFSPFFRSNSTLARHHGRVISRTRFGLISPGILPSQSAGSLFFFIFFSCSLWSGWWAPFNQQNGILAFLHCARVEITSCAMVNMKMPCFLCPCPGQAPPAVPLPTFHPALPTLCLDPFPPLFALNVWDGRRRDISTGPGTVRRGTGTGHWYSTPWDASYCMPLLQPQHRQQAFKETQGPPSLSDH